MAISVSSTAGVPVVSCAAKNPMGRSTWSSSIQACACFSASARSLPRGSCTTMGTLAATFLFNSNEIDTAITTGETKLRGQLGRVWLNKLHTQVVVFKEITNRMLVVNVLRPCASAGEARSVLYTIMPLFAS